MSDDPDSVRTRMEQLSTEDLFSILRERNDEEWRPEALEIVAAVLRERGVSPAEIQALPPAGTDVIEDQPVASIARFFNPGEAHAFKMALAEAGIPAWVADQSVGTMYGIGIGNRLLVRTSDLAAAHELLDSAAASAAELPPELAEPPCPACGSRNVASEAWFAENAEATEKGRGWLGSLRKWHYVCGDCKNAWPA